MGLIQNAIKKWRDKKEEKSDYERQQRVMEGYEQRKLSSNERELIRWEEEERQKMIKRALEKFRKRQQEEIWRGRTNNPVFTPNIIKDNKDLFKDGNLFFGKANSLNGGNLFFKK